MAILVSKVEIIDQIAFAGNLERCRLSGLHYGIICDPARSAYARFLVFSARAEPDGKRLQGFELRHVDVGLDSRTWTPSYVD